MEDDLFSLAGRVALVTGGGRGLGMTMAEGLAVRGAHVAVADLDELSARRAAMRLSGLGPNAIGLRADVTDRAAADAAVAATLEAFGRLDILVNNAGVAVIGPAEVAPVETVRKVFEVDVYGIFNFSQAAFPHMAEHKRGAIINIASIAGISVLSPLEHASYSAAKAAVIMLTRSLAVEWAPFGVRVNAIAPGYMLTEAGERLRANDPPTWAQWMSQVPMGRAGNPDELQGAAVFLASRAASYITGSVLVVDGGQTCH